MGSGTASHPKRTLPTAVSRQKLPTFPSHSSNSRKGQSTARKVAQAPGQLSQEATITLQHS